MVFGSNGAGNDATAVYTTHNLAEAAELCDRIAGCAVSLAIFTTWAMRGLNDLILRQRGLAAMARSARSARRARHRDAGRRAVAPRGRLFERP